VVAITAATAPATATTIVIVGGLKAGMVDGEHDFPDGALKLERLIKASPDFARLKPKLKVYPVGFPKDLGEIADADVVVLYSGSHRDGTRQVQPLDDPAARAAVGRIMAKGGGLVALHQAFTSGDPATAAALREWLGGVRPAKADLALENAPLALAGGSHPVTSGVGAFNYLDEFYPTLELAKTALPVLTARIHVQQRAGAAVFQEPAKARTVAWTYQRPNGGRAFGYSGGHYLSSLDQPQVRKTLLNAILWSAKADVPAAGAESTVPALPPFGQPVPAVSQRVVLPAGDVAILPQPWGKLQWFVSREIGNSQVMTVGQATIAPGQANPPHWHPNCDEVLHVVRGHIMHRVGDKEYEMKTGDTVSIPEGTIHNARNIGQEDAILMVSFNSADRVAIGEN
jgi:quercetin dioxygenase-like cupin family protein